MNIEKSVEQPLQFSLTSPSHHQLEVLADYAPSGILLNHGLGSGKTFTALSLLAQCCARESIPPNALVVAPSIVLEHWKKEAEKHFEDNFFNRVLVLRGSVAKRCKLMQEALNSKSASIFVTTHQALHNQKFLSTIKKIPFTCLVIDESHCFKNPQAKMTKSVTEIASRFKHRILLTGTPILNNLMDIYSQVNIVQPYLLGSSFWTFRNKYFFDANAFLRGKVDKSKYWPKWEVRKSMLEELMFKVNSVMHTVKTEDVVKDLPPFDKVKISCELSKDDKKVYSEMLKGFKTEIADTKLSARNVIVKTLRLQQICSMSSGKLDALKMLLESINEESVVIWCNFKRKPIELIEALLQKLKISYGVIHGDINPLERARIIEKFNNKEIQILVATQPSLGIGVELTTASVMIYYSKSYNLGHDSQSEGRAYRRGSHIHKRVVRYDLVLEKTIDEVVHESLERKLEESEFINRVKEL